ncbi:MAG: Fur family transcriptional regulator [Brevefilum sp.]
MDLQKELNKQGLRLTQPRRDVLDVLEQAQVPLSPQTIHERTVAAGADIGLATVYRTLDLLDDFGLVRRVHGPEACHGYVLASPGHHHTLVCKGCAKTVEFTGSEDLDALLARIEKNTGFQIQDHLLQLNGLCPDCQEGTQRRP